MAFDPRHRSHTLVDGPERAAARSYFHSVGYSAEDLKKPLIMVAHEWIGTMPCNFSQRVLAQRGDDLVFVDNATAGINAVLQSLPFAATLAFHKRCSTIETNTTTIIATIITCPVALSKNPR